MAEEVDVAPAERDQLAAAKTGISGETDQLGVLSIFTRASIHLGPRRLPDGWDRDVRQSASARASASTCSGE